MTALRQAFPNYDIRMHYITTETALPGFAWRGVIRGGHRALDLEGGYINQVSDSLEVLSDFDESMYCEDLLDPDDYFPLFPRECHRHETTTSCQSEEFQLLPPTRTSWIPSMPVWYHAQPQDLGTGYNFLKSLVNAWGEDAALTTSTRWRRTSTSSRPRVLAPERFGAVRQQLGLA